MSTSIANAQPVCETNVSHAGRGYGQLAVQSFVYDSAQKTPVDVELKIHTGLFKPPKSVLLSNLINAPRSCNKPLTGDGEAKDPQSLTQ